MSENSPAIWDEVWRSAHPSSQEIADAMHVVEQQAGWRFYDETVRQMLGDWSTVSSIELGAGASTNSVLAAARGAHVVILDYSNEALRVARERCVATRVSATFIQANALRLPPELIGEFKLSWSFGTAEHFVGPDRSKFVAAHRSVISPGGIAIMTVPRKWAINYQLWMSIAKLAGEWPFGLEVPFSRGELKGLSSEAGFEFICIQRMAGNPCGQKTMGIVRRNWKLLYPLARTAEFLARFLPSSFRRALTDREYVLVVRRPAAAASR